MLRDHSILAKIVITPRSCLASYMYVVYNKPNFKKKVGVLTNKETKRKIVKDKKIYDAVDKLSYTRFINQTY